jgi:hypothetical protein
LLSIIAKIGVYSDHLPLDAGLYLKIEMIAVQRIISGKALNLVEKTA